MNYFEWHNWILARMCLARGARSAWDEVSLITDYLEAFDKEAASAIWLADRAGLRCTLILQLPDDGRKVHLLKDGQPNDECEQCECCWYFMPASGDASGYYEAEKCLVGRDLEQQGPCCLDWLPETYDPCKGAFP